ncbi:MAG: carbamoyl phosphate synthase small subunit [Butyrivibrio sp.]|nr:carbamoyl phosphate synthase small subunit [Butyrivibrio sp.]
MKAFLILEDGTVFEGKHIGADKDVVSEIVFNTSMTGYTEVFTDPSYAGQAVCMTYPLIGNYGVCLDDMESEKIWPDAVIVREMARVPSNFRCDMSLQEFLEKYETPGIEGIDTRKLVRILREKGTMNGYITTNENVTYESIKDKLHAYTTGDVVSKVSCKEKVRLTAPNPRGEKIPKIAKEQNGKGLKVALLDVGAKRNISDALLARGCEVTIYPYNTTAEEILADKPDGIMLSNGPGDPKECTGVIEQIKKLYNSDVPIFAICLGHQLMALATGSDTYKLHYGHRGGNHPVKDLATGRVYISSQNHGYVVDTEKLDKTVAAPAFMNVNDGTNEGLKYVGKNIFTVQFHPEACPGPQDTGYLFDRFISMMRASK